MITLKRVIFYMITCLITYAIILSFATAAEAAKIKTATKKAPANAPTGKKLSTNINFEDMLVDGKYQYPAESMTTVENEKNLDDLLGVRKHFKDRLTRSIDRR